MQTGSLTIELELRGDCFSAVARIERDEPGEIAFLLNADCVNEGATCGGAAVALVDEGPAERGFRPHLRAWRVPGERSELTLRYRGTSPRTSSGGDGTTASPRRWPA